jgi:ribosomal protein S18 acetylase RimI-like enzyme
MVQIRPAASDTDLEEVRVLFREYADQLGFDLAFQEFDAELNGLPGEYVPPGGALLLATEEDGVAGCVALRPLEPRVCEMKRLYLRPAYRGKGVGRALTKAVIDEARTRGYRAMRLDTTPGLTEAIALYRSLGFREIEPYRLNPIPGALFMELDL